MGTPPTIDNFIHSFVWVGQFRLCSDLINEGGGAIRMSWYVFFEKKIVGGDVFSGLESTCSVKDLKIQIQVFQGR